MSYAPRPNPQLSDSELLAALKAAAASERQATAHLIALLADVDVRRIYLGEGCSSLFTYCTQVLHLSEHAAYGRIEAARAAAKFPLVLELLETGAITLTTVTLLAPHLTALNHRDVLSEARHKRKREIEHLVARLRPQPAVESTVRKLPTPPQRDAGVMRPAAEVVARADPSVAPAPVAPRPAVVAPLAPERYKVQVTVSRETYDKLRRAQDLLRHSVPTGDPAAIFDRALTVLLKELERTKLGATLKPRAPRKPSPGSRHIPSAVRREVWARDGGQCAFVGSEGRCQERGFLEFHHVVPYAKGGLPAAVNIELRCQAHNQYEAEQHFGLFVRDRPAPAYVAGLGPGPGSIDTSVPKIHHAEDSGVGTDAERQRQDRDGGEARRSTECGARSEHPAVIRRTERERVTSLLPERLEIDPPEIDFGAFRLNHDSSFGPG